MSDLREALESAIDEDTSAADETIDTSAASVDTADTEREPEGKPAVEGRDALGRFLKKEDNAEAAAAEPAPQPAVADQSAVATPQPEAAAPQAPQSWGPALREKWGTLPPEVQQQVVQRETQMQRWANETAPMRQAGEQFMQAIQPYQMAIQAEGVDPITAVTNLMQVGTTLRFGTPAEKATTIAKLVKVYGVDIGALDGALVGEVPQNGQGYDPQAIQAMVQQQLQPLYQMAQQRRAQEQAEVETTTRQTIQQFAAKPENKYFDDVRGLMADITEVATKNGQNISLDEAYKRACLLHPEVSQLMMSQQQGQTAQSLTRAAAKARGAAVSVKGGAPVGSPNRSEPSSIRDSIEAAIESHSGY